MCFQGGIGFLGYCLIKVRRLVIGRFDFRNMHVVEMHHGFRFMAAGGFLITFGVDHSPMFQSERVEPRLLAQSPVLHRIAHRAPGIEEIGAHNYGRGSEIDAAQGCSSPISR